jgi:hypothetical protein
MSSVFNIDEWAGNLSHSFTQDGATRIACGEGFAVKAKIEVLPPEGPFLFDPMGRLTG